MIPILIMSRASDFMQFQRRFFRRMRIRNGGNPAMEDERISIHYRDSRFPVFLNTITGIPTEKIYTIDI